MTTARGDNFSYYERHPSSRRRDLEQSMLEYADRMKFLTSTKRPDLRPHHSQYNTNTSLDHKANKYLVYRHNDQNEIRRYPQQRSEAAHNNRLLKQRPQSLNEKELLRNKLLTEQRPKRDIKSERPPVLIPSGLPKIEDATATQPSKPVKIGFVSTSALYDLVDMTTNSPGGSRGQTTKLANVHQGIKLVEELTKNHRKMSSHRNSPDFTNLGKSQNTRLPSSTSDPENNSRLLPKSTPKTGNVVSRHDGYALRGVGLSKREETCTKSDSDDDGDEKSGPLDVLFDHASTHYPHFTADGNSLKLRPKRARRMVIQKPELVAIPEDGGSFIRTGSGELSKNGVFSRVAMPSTTSLNAIKVFNGKSRHVDSVYHRSEDRTTDSRRRHCKSNTQEHVRPNGRHRDKFSRASTNDIDIDKLMSISIYPTLSWGSDGERKQAKSDLPTVQSENANHKERAHKKMKRLIFLRDQPDNNYRR